jgi:hypothetical protein
MTLKGFLFLLGVTVLTVIVAGLIAERYAAPGFERTLVVAGIAALVVFPAGKFAERRGWVKGELQLGELKNEFGRGARRNAGASADATTNSKGEAR